MGQQVSTDGSNAYAHTNTIITVKEGSPARTPLNKHVEEDQDFKALQKLPKFSPLMRGSLNLPIMRDSGILDKIDSKDAISFINRYEEHLKLCSQTVTVDQVMLASRMKEIDVLMDLVMNKVAERQHKLNAFASCARATQSIENCIQKIRNDLEDCITLAEQFNNILPDGHKLEPLRL